MSERRVTEALQLALFAALGAFAALHWATLVENPPAGRILLAVAALTAAGRAARRAEPLAAAAARRARRRAGRGPGAASPPRWPSPACRCGCCGRATGTSWASELEQGLSGIQTVVWPYGGPEDDVRLAILLGAPALLALAAALAFWPVRSRITASVLRFMALAALLCLYGIPVTDHDPGDPLLRGLVLFALVAAWLWAPRMRGREACPPWWRWRSSGLVALPLAARVDRAEALVDYSEWNWFGGKEVSFNWDHSYGPLDWPRDGTTLLEVRSPRPLYWKAEVLDTFDGLRWVRSRSNDRTSPLGELPDDPDTRWDRSITVTVRSLRTDFVIGTGTPYRVLGAGEAVSGAADGTLRRLTEPLRRGDQYTVRAYAPTPNAAADARGAGRYEHRAVPVHRRGAAAAGRERAGHRATSRARWSARERVEVPLRGGDGGTPAIPAAALRGLARTPAPSAWRGG